MKSKARKITVIALFAAISYVLAFVETSLPIFPSFLKVDISMLPVLISSFVFGPLSGIMIALVKNLLHLPTTQTAGIGQLADFLIATSMCLVAGGYYKLHKNRKGALIGCLLGIVAMIVVGVVTNKFILIPFYSKLMPIDAIIGMAAKVNPLIKDINGYLLYAVAPFNLFKGAVITGITVFVYKKMSAFIHSFTQR